ncbi:MAG TPA: DUF222 domain-containing protein [Streptosporangiaceae bacterium]|nr:DUF222 domain-containing protein [Streptosporangiaceae bacterium]
MTISPAGQPPGDWDGPEPHEPSDAELLGAWPDPFAGPPDGADAWLADLSVPELERLAERWAAENGAGIDVIGAGFTHATSGDAAGAVGFAAGGALDVMAPDPVLAGFASDAFESGLAGLSDDELVGVLCAARRLSSWQAWMEFSAVAELDNRRRVARGIGSSRTAEHVNDELAAALTLTGRSAEALLVASRDLSRLPSVLAALKAGVIDRAKAGVFAAELAGLPDRHAQVIAAALWRPAAKMTTGQLRAELKALALMVDPEAARRRRERARDEARVEAWQEGSGNSGLAGRELPTSEAIIADKRITAIARELKSAGAAGTIDQLRAAVFTALLTGRDPATLLPGPAPDTGSDTGSGSGASARARAGGWPASITGAVNLTMPLRTWNGWSQAPGEIAGLGPIDADACRDLADRLAASPRARWCLTLIDDDGNAAGHACARSGPGSAPGKDPPKPRSSGPLPPSLATWLRSLSVEWLERGTCTHRRQVDGYRPSAALGHLIKIRQRTCTSPGCRQPAAGCDLDHTVPYEQGGVTCECNLGPLCRKHHQCKQAPGWHLTQTSPGSFTWTAPHGRAYEVRPRSYSS